MTSLAAESPTDTDESPPFCQAHVRALPRHQAAWAHHGHLHEPAPQAAAGLAKAPVKERFGSYRRCESSEPEAARDRADLHLRDRTAVGAEDLRRPRPLARHEGP